MATKKPAKPKNSDAELQQAVDKMYKSLAAFMLAKYCHFKRVELASEPRIV